ncbi:nodulin-related protein 1-like [Mercurialis annua]|uniref:nodulin-related protein 1-like n=1 Tax=Mercurialis annua TaxID=3986 RepID=UPI002160CFBB|nr:nodulin-related protein 1-like [Mercurialis annua]
MDFPSSNNQPSKPGHKHHQVSSSELFSSAKIVADAAKSRLNNEKIDEGKAAGAAANILGAASQYGKLEEKSFGKYVEQAEDYLHKYQSSHSTTTAAAAGHQTGSDTSTTTHSTSTQSSGEHEKSSGSGGVGDYFKMAQGFMK